ncbi:hypothetical protein QQ045_013892 [Rhodiola kirilowii]
MDLLLKSPSKTRKRNQEAALTSGCSTIDVSSPPLLALGRREDPTPQRSRLNSEDDCDHHSQVRIVNSRCFRTNMRSNYKQNS